jgi:hypothetical protein
MNGMVIGKRTTIGAAITSLAGVAAHFFPEHAAAFIGMAVPITFAAQVYIANKFGVTTKP